MPTKVVKVTPARFWLRPTARRKGVPERYVVGTFDLVCFGVEEDVLWMYMGREVEAGCVPGVGMQGMRGVMIFGRRNWLWKIVEKL